MFIFKLKSPAIMPNLNKIKDEGAKEVSSDINKIIQDMVRGTLDDFKALERVERVDSLPTPTIDNSWKLFVLNGTGTGADTVHISIDTGGGGYAFKQVTLT